MRRVARDRRFDSGAQTAGWTSGGTPDLEAHAKAERAAIDALVKRATKPVELPSPDFVLRKLVAFRNALEEEPVLARERLRTLFEQGRLLLEPQPEGHSLAKSVFFPMRVFRFALEPTASPRPGLQKTLDHNPGGMWSSTCCAGAMRPTSTSEEEVVPYAFLVPKPPDRRRMPESWKRQTSDVT